MKNNKKILEAMTNYGSALQKATTNMYSMILLVFIWIGHLTFGIVQATIGVTVFVVVSYILNGYDCVKWKKKLIYLIQK